MTADIDSTVISHLMALDAFAHHGLGSSALMVIAALHARPGQTVTELIATSSVSRATVYRALRRLAAHGLVQHDGEAWDLAPRALEGIGNGHLEAGTAPAVPPARGWDDIAQRYGTAGVAAHRTAVHAAERAAYRAALERRAEHRNEALVIMHGGQPVLVPATRADEVPLEWRGPGGGVIDPATGRTVEEWKVATDGRLILITSADQRTHDELVAAHAQAVTEWESAA
ncbi:MarR family transcriptional regulator [Actinacidiphila oryziradicis]|uniref:MarR family transcriptional regulator n=1 Tax=Actinacidiphila oryziradicis TaxID=2571141 RepID=UPI001FE8E959|nr:helix-turn-helix domain-containing protein [Actinacidiphila oryziradicis]